MISKETGNVATTENTTATNAPLSKKRRVLLYALTPVALLILLTPGMRLASEAAERQNVRTEAEDEKALKAFLNGNPAPGRPLPQIPVSKPADAATQKNIETAVRGQISAIHAGDYARALTFAVPGFRSQTTPEYFGQLIHSGYSPSNINPKLRNAGAVSADSLTEGAMNAALAASPSGDRAVYKTPEELYAAAEARETVRIVVDTLPTAQREVLDLYYWAELTLPEIANVLNRNLNTVKYQFYRGHDLVAQGMAGVERMAAVSAARTGQVPSPSAAKTTRWETTRVKA